MLKKSVILNSVSRVFHILEPSHKKRAGLIILLILFSGILEVLGLAAIMPVVSVALDRDLIRTNEYLAGAFETFGFQSESWFLVSMAMGLLVLFIFKNVFILFINYMQSSYSYKVSLDFSNKRFGAYFNKNLGFFTEHSSSQMVNMIANVTQSFSTFVILPLMSVISELVVLGLVIIGIALYTFKVFLLLVCVISPAAIIIYMAFGNRMHVYRSRQNEIAPLQLKNMMEGVQSFIHAKLHNKESFFMKRHNDLMSEKMNLMAILSVMGIAPVRMVELFAVAGIAVIFWLSLVILENGEALIQILAVFAVAAYRLMPSVNRILIGVLGVRSGQFAIEAMEQIFEQDDLDLSAGVEQVDEIAFTKTIKVESLSFSYEESEAFALNDVSMEVQKGQAIGLFGKSGSGKTTLLNILLRFLHETGGHLVIDDLQIEAKHTSAWRKKIGYVQQDLVMLDASITENVAFGEEQDDVDLERVWKVLEQASIAEFVKELPDGLDTLLGERGTRLSGGQRQRIGIARALYKGAEVMVFDEATSALDQDTERAITESIRSLSEEDITIFIIAHRLTTLEYCDKIFEMEDGRIKRSMTYKELLAHTNSEA